MLENLTDWATEIVERLGYPGVAMLVALENVFPPIPSEVVLGLAGYTASQGDAWVVGMIIAATIGSVVGAWILYGLSAAVGPVRLRAIIIRYGTWVGFGETDLDRAEASYGTFQHFARPSRQGRTVLFAVSPDLDRRPPTA